MIRSLRVRFFLTVFPLVLTAIVGVGLLFGRWTRTELATYEREVRISAAAPAGATAAQAIAREVAGAWPESVTTPGALTAAATKFGTAGNILAFDAAGTLLASSDARIGADDVTLLEDGTVRVRRSTRRGPRASEQEVQVAATRIMRDGVVIGHLAVVPHPAPPPAAASELTDAAEREILRAVLLASAIAALATLLLARPIVSQVGRLVAAARRVGAGDLAARVSVTSSDELGQLERSFNEMAARLEQEEAVRRRLVSDVAHELRTPLTNIIGTLEAVQDGLRTADGDTIASLHEEARLLHALVHDVQELSLADAGELRLDLQTVDVSAIASRAVQASGSLARDVALHGPGFDAPPVFAIADERRLMQVLRNLLLNALTHTPGGGSVRVDVHAADDAGDDGGGYVALRVSDTGIGIPAEHLPLVWERFHRVDPSRARATGGMGLGLAVVKKLVEAMGGSVHAESVPGAGSSFEVRLRRAHAQADVRSGRS